MSSFLKIAIVLVAGSFLIAVSSRLASESRSLVIGVVIGVVVSLPAVVIAMLLLGRPGEQEASPAARPMYRQPPPQTPPVVIVNSANGAGQRGGRWQPYPPDPYLPSPQPRQFTIIGEEGEKGEEGEEER